MEQRTLAQSFTLRGVGIHTGTQSKVTVHPAEVDTGRLFRVGQTVIPARADAVQDTRRCTTLGVDSVTVCTVEHLLSALHGCCIDNAVIEVDGPEIPILDGSALPFTEAILSTGILKQGRPPRVLTLQEPVIIEERVSQAAARPSLSGCLLTVETRFEEWPEGTFTASCPLGEEMAETYLSAVAPARTFAFRHEVEALLAAGLAKGGSLDNALVITPPDGFSTPLRLEGEWCVHKLLDLIGDMALADARLAGAISLARPGHRINTLLANAVRQAGHTATE